MCGNAGYLGFIKKKKTWNQEKAKLSLMMVIVKNKHASSTILGTAR